MPELPEVETIVRDLRPHLVGLRIAGLQLNHPSVLRFPDPVSLRARAEGQSIRGVRRRGKFIHLVLDSGDHLVIHLGMSGTLTLEPERAPLRPHTHLAVGVPGAGELRYRDPRRFGRVLLGRPGRLRRAGVLPRLGPEPLARGFAASSFGPALQRTRRPLKAALLDQAVVAGCGNIYADEACFEARLRPGRPGASLSQAEVERLARALRRVMRRAVRRRGTSFSDYRDGFGARGEAYEQLRVYGRGGLPCIRCGATLRQGRIAGRTTVWCAECQS
ncbi:MAG: bifunctional DNA-formamidopyrimidine glycosylase/DNA-(apurinic or apyrimidinic site) lyase [Candidatus Dormibacteria bacterium]